jgi:hypothetical protein
MSIVCDVSYVLLNTTGRLNRISQNGKLAAYPATIVQ